jgi:hypothetical protein
MNDGTVSNMGGGSQQNSYSRKHMYRTVFLHVTAILDNDLSPVAPQGTAGPYIHVPADHHVAGNGCLWMNKGRFMDYRFYAVEFVKH